MPIYAPFSDSMITHLQKPNVNVDVAVEIEFDSGTSRVHLREGDLYLNGFLYTGIGTLGNLSTINEENNVNPTQLTATLSGLDNYLLTQTLNEPCVNRGFTAYLVVLDEDEMPSVWDIIFKGFISESYAVTGKNPAISYKTSNIFEKWSVGLSDRYTDKSHIKKFPGDRFFRYTNQVADRAIYWGGKKDAPSFRYE
ncbi:hypothetical protein [Vibrio phage vB_VibM_83AMN]|nr:hypothetical protein [Vibrio phage vB_VibM_83AMN]